MFDSCWPLANSARATGNVYMSSVLATTSGHRKLFHWARNTSTPSVANDDILLTATGLGPTSTILFFQGTQRENGGMGSVFGDGLLCASGTVIRLGGRIASGGTASFGYGDGTPALVSVRGMLPAGGGLRTYQGWYRNQAPAFCTPAPFNLTNGLEIPWAP